MADKFLEKQREALQRMLDGGDRPNGESNEAIQEALLRIEEGEYEQCQAETSANCREEIPRGLLARYPTADACRDCKRPASATRRAFKVQETGPVCGSGISP